MADGFHRLRHDTVIGGNNQNGNIRCHGASGSHGGESGVTRCVKEGDHLTVTVHSVRTDVLGNAAGFGCGNGGVPDRVKDRSFTVVNVTHNNDNRISRKKIFGGVLTVVDDSFLDGDFNFLFDLCAKLGGNDFGGIIVDCLIDRSHDAERKQLFDNLGGGHMKFHRKVADGDFIGNLDRNGFLGSFGGDSLESFRLGFTLGGTHTLLSVLLGFLFQLLLGSSRVLHATCRSNLFITLVVLIQVNVTASCINVALFALGSCLNGLISALFVFLLLVGLLLGCFFGRLGLLFFYRFFRGGLSVVFLFRLGL